MFAMATMLTPETKRCDRMWTAKAKPEDLGSALSAGPSCRGAEGLFVQLLAHLNYFRYTSLRDNADLSVRRVPERAIAGPVIASRR
jgi:hypothetical protein